MPHGHLLLLPRSRVALASTLLATVELTPWSPPPPQDPCCACLDPASGCEAGPTVSSSRPRAICCACLDPVGSYEIGPVVSSLRSRCTVPAPPPHRRPRPPETSSPGPTHHRWAPTARALMPMMRAVSATSSRSRRREICHS